MDIWAKSILAIKRNWWKRRNRIESGGKEIDEKGETV